MKYRFSKTHRDADIMRIQKEIEDNLATRSEVDEKYKKVTKIEGSPPQVIDLDDGQTKVYVNGSTKRRYYRVGGRLFYSELTEV